MWQRSPAGAQPTHLLQKHKPVRVCRVHTSLFTGPKDLESMARRFGPFCVQCVFCFGTVSRQVIFVRAGATWQEAVMHCSSHPFSLPASTPLTFFSFFVFSSPSSSAQMRAHFHSRVPPSPTFCTRTRSFFWYLLTKVLPSHLLLARFESPTSNKQVQIDSIHL